MPSKTELFLDDELIEMTASITRRIHQPVKHRLNPVLRPEHWWEQDCTIPIAVMYDPEDKLFKTWYRTGDRCGPRERTLDKRLDGHACFTAYATSRDGVHWEKPALGVLELNGRKDHNVVMVSPGLNANPAYHRQGKKLFFRSVVRHPHPRDENEKYVCMFFDQRHNGAYLGYSADGIHWRREEKPFWRTLVDAAAWGDDTLMGLIYDKFKRRWVVYRRVNPQESERLVARPGDESWPAPDRGLRIMAYADSPDLKRWENHRIIMVPDADDPADVEFYGLNCYNYAQVYVGYLWVYHIAPDDETIDVQLVTSRDGLHFTRCCRREPFIPCSPPDYYDRMITLGDSAEPIIVDDRVHLYYEACNFNHDGYDGAVENSVMTGSLCTFTRDRFVSLETGGPPPCRFVTRPFVVEHPKLFLNAATWGDGSIQVEALGRDWRVLPGYSKKEANVVKGNALNHPVFWKGSGDLGGLAGKEVRLQFCMSDARLHAMTFDTEDRPLKELPPLRVGRGMAARPVET